ncbi:MAG: hypothetical protein RIS64_3682 [Bacteroidota bacterium]|jgi:hypothetical protein
MATEVIKSINMTEDVNNWYRNVIIQVLNEITPMENQGKKIIPKNLKCLRFCNGSAKAANDFYKAALKARNAYIAAQNSELKEKTK